MLPPDAPAEWGEFRILSELGHGGFGRVYRAMDEGLAKEVALKIVRPSNPSRVADVMREGQMLARIRHQNVVTVHAVRRVGDEVGFVMDLIDGESLSDWVHRVGRLGAEEAIAIGETLCHAVAAVHAAGVLHRDIKARNVMRDSSGRIVLMDLGAGRDESAPAVDDLTGTPLYLAPELYRRQSASRASDIYSLGVLMYFLVTGTFPVEGQNARDVAEAHLTGRRRLLVDRRPDLPSGFIHVVERAIAATPEQRYQSAGALLEDFHSLVMNRPLPASESGRRVGTLSSPWPTRLARWAVIAGAGLVSLLLLGFLATRVYDKAFDVGSYSDDSLRTWFRFGLRAVVPPLIFVLMVIVAWLIMRSVWRLLRPAVPAVDRLASRVQSTVSSAVTRRASANRPALAHLLLVAQIAVVVVVYVQYYPLFMALITPFDRADPAVWQILNYGPDDLGPVNDYQAFLPIAAAAMALAWHRLVRSSGGLVAMDRTVLGAGLAITALMFAGAAVPFRVFYDARNLHHHKIDGERCYEVGRRDSDARVFCPDFVPTPTKSRVWTVPVTKLGEPLGQLSPYAAAK